MKIDSKAKVRDIAGEKVVIMQGRLGADLTRIIQLNGSSVWLLEQLADRDFEVADVTKDFESDAVINHKGVDLKIKHSFLLYSHQAILSL